MNGNERSHLLHFKRDWVNLQAYFPKKMSKQEIFNLKCVRELQHIPKRYLMSLFRVKDQQWREVSDLSKAARMAILTELSVKKCRAVWANSAMCCREYCQALNVLITSSSERGVSLVSVERLPSLLI